jgi:hypothetical protein
MKAGGMKQDSRSAQWARIISGFDARQTTVRAYCQQHKINEHSFYCWRRRLSKNNGGTRPLTFRVMEHRLATQPVEIILTNGAILRVACEEQAIRTVLAAMK